LLGTDGRGDFGGKPDETAETVGGGGGVAGVVVGAKDVDALDGCFGGGGGGEGLFVPPGEAISHVDAFVVVYVELAVDADETVVEEVSGGMDGEGVVAVIGDDPAAAVVLEEVVGALVFPGGVTEFDGVAEVCGKIFEEEFDIGEFGGGESGRELDENGAEFAGGLHGTEGAEEGFHGAVAEGDGGIVGDLFGGFDAEGEIGRDGVGPFLDAFGGGGGLEGGVEFEGVEGGGVGGEVFVGAGAFGVQDGLPVRVGEADGADVPVHGSNLLLLDCVR